MTEEAPSPFHEGERMVQERFGVRDRVEATGRRGVRPYMPEQHREFYAGLPFVLIGAADNHGRPWASLVAGTTGFVSSADPRTLDIAALPSEGDPLESALAPGVEIGLLGLELETRRRNRLAGRISARRGDGFTIVVSQSFGNCPRYIQSRSVEQILDDREASHVQLHRSETLDQRSREIISAADTLFIATAYTRSADDWSHGADVSHRGGKPGFIRVEDAQTLVFPDFPGNNHFNTVGNLALNKACGVLFLDFRSGDTVALTGEAEIIWDGPEVAKYSGAERLIRVRATEVLRTEAHLRFKFEFLEYSPMTEGTGGWSLA